MAGEMFRKLAGIDIVHVPYKGTTTALPDLMSGRVSMIFDGGAFLSFVQPGKLRIFAVTSTERLESAPTVPTMAEAGVPGYEMDFWFGIVAPAGTPRPIVERLARDIDQTVRTPSFKERLRAFGNVRISTTSPQAMGEIIKRDIGRWDTLLKDAGVTAQ
jgi:tripartite-type tricarboxylate transporter receptor subunit TctC